MAFQEDMNDNPPTLPMVDLEEEDTMVESTELIGVDLEEADSDQGEYESEDGNDDDIEDQYQYYDKDEDDNEENLWTKVASC